MNDDDDEFLSSLVERLPSFNKGSFTCPSCYGVASITGEGPRCEDGCTPEQMRKAVKARPATCGQDHDPYGNPASKCPMCRFEVQWADEEAARLVKEHRLDLLHRSVREGSGVTDAMGRFPLYTASEVAKRVVYPDTLPGILGPPGTVTEVTGYRGTGKSLWVHGIAQAVGHGFEEVYGLPLRLHGPVLYVAREGVPGWTKRVRAWAAHHDLPDAGDRVTFLHDAIDITKGGDLAALSAILLHLEARLLVLDPVAMTGGGKEDEETYQQYRLAALELASERGLVVILLTNTGHAVRTRGRNSSMLVDGMDQSVALVKDEKSGLVTVTPNKERDMGKVEGLHVRFEGAGEEDPETGRVLSGVMVRVAAEDAKAEELARRVKEVNRALDLASRVLLGRCDCKQGTEGAREFPEGCARGGGR